MLGRWRIPVTVVSLLSAMVVMAAPAAADGGEVVDQAQYEAAYAAAADASGLFAPNMTVTFTSDGRTDGDISVTVNADGSLIGRRTHDSVPVDIRCVRVDRCWERSLGAYGNAKWHRLAAGSVVYQSARDYWSAWMGFPWPSGSYFVLMTGSDGTPVFGVGVPLGDQVVVNVAAFSGASVENQVAYGTSSFAQPLRSGTMSGTTTPTPVTAPPRKSLGVPATQFAEADVWVVPINPRG